MVRFRASAGKSNKTVSTSWSFTGDRRFESVSLQERVHSELDHDVELAVDVEITWHEQIAEEIERASEPGVDTAPSRKPPHFQAKPPADNPGAPCWATPRPDCRTRGFRPT